MIFLLVSVGWSSAVFTVKILSRLNPKDYWPEKTKLTLDKLKSVESICSSRGASLSLRRGEELLEVATTTRSFIVEIV